MQIAWSEFTPGASLLGGLLIGLAAALFMLGSGRVAGIAGVVGGALQGLVHHVSIGHNAVRWAFIAGLLLAPWLWRLVAPLPAAQVDVGITAIVAAGLLVGFGVRLGNGCTSGHGVCGLSRLSLRSLANVGAFMGAGVVTVYVLRHVLG
jgi:uncharacterized protein